MGLQRVGHDWATFTFTITSTLFFFSSSMNFSTSINSRTHHHSQDIEEFHLSKTLLVSLSIVMLSPHHQQPGSYCLFSMTTVLAFQECLMWYICVVSVQFSQSVVSNFATPQTATRLPCPSPTPAAYSNSCLSSRWCHPVISPFFTPFSSHLQSFPATGSFPLS